MALAAGAYLAARWIIHVRTVDDRVRLKARYDVTLETLTTTSESMAFPLPRDLREMA